MDQARLKSIMDYDVDSGVFISTVRRGAIRVGDQCGYADTLGYVRIEVGGRSYLAHRLAFVWVLGRWPNGVVDHIDRDPSNNSWSNLRECTKQQNHFNSRRRKPNRSGIRGVYPTPSGRWIASITYNGRQLHLGIHDTKEDARRAREEAARRYFGEFAAFD